ncbi:MAG: glycosyltransferase, partial [Clostridia bacterium]|nr:glycosyltransferase [Clostridia bacterium]
MKISLIVPCYNEEDSLSALYGELTSVSQKMSDYEFEYLFIDDGSHDKTLDIIKGFSKSDARVTYISFSKNFGKEAAMYAGFCNATGDYVAVI